MNKKTNLIWIDLEMTGLSPENDVIIEIATVVTDADLNIIDEGPSLVIHQDNNYLDGMDEWNTNQHNHSGLVQRVQESKISTSEAEQQTIDFIVEQKKQRAFYNWAKGGLILSAIGLLLIFVPIVLNRTKS